MAVINTNYLSLVSQNNLRTSQSALGSAIERLSSGLRINNAKDDAAGMAIANRMTAQVRGMTQAARNANDGISLAQTAEGNMKEINGNLQRIRELAVQAANDTNNAGDRDAINTEIAQRMAEIDRIAKSAEFNGIHLLDSGNTLTQATGRNISFQVGSNTNIDQDVITIKGDSLIDATLAGLGLSAVGGSGTGETAPVLSFDAASKEVKGASGEVIGKTATDFDPKVGGDLFDKADPSKKIGTIAADGTVKDTDGKVLGKIGSGSTYAEPTANGIKSDGTVLDANGNVVGKADADAISGKGGKIFDAADPNKQVGVIGADGTIKTETTPGSNVFDKEAGKIAGYKSADNKTNLDAGNTAESARALITKIDEAMTKVDTGRANLGAIQNRLESTVNNLNNNINNLSASRSRIEDADYAVEVSNMTRAQILQQAGTSVLAQANQVPQTVLTLLR